MEIRKDYVLDRYVILSTERAKRPSDFLEKENKEIELKEYDEKCPFCFGNEHLTTKEIGRIEKDGKWIMRWVENKFPAVKESKSYKIRTDNEYFTFSYAHGYHEVIIETNKHNVQLWDFSQQEIALLLKVYNNRIKELSSKPGIKYVHVFKNHGKDAGTSLIHSHSQVIAYNIIPYWIREKIKKVIEMNKCPYCDIVKIESNSYRTVLNTDNFVTFTPYASQYPFEVNIFPKSHIKTLEEIEKMNLIDELAYHLYVILKGLKRLKCSYNFLICYAPLNYDLHFHIEVKPRLTKTGGFEFGGTYINVVTPEDAANFYREMIKDG